MKEITVITKNELGALASICEILGGAGINIHGISASGIENKSIIKIVTSDPTSSENFLHKKGYKTKINEVVVVKVNDNPGELGKMISRVSRERVNLEGVYLLNKHKEGYAEIVFVPENEKEVQIIIDAVGKNNIV